MSQNRIGAFQLVRWAARISSVISLALLTAFIFSGGDTPTVSESVALAFFPGGVALGMVVGWWREALGGLMSVASLGGFYLWMASAGRAPHGPYFLLFTIPAFLFLATGAIRLFSSPR